MKKEILTLIVVLAIYSCKKAEKKPTQALETKLEQKVVKETTIAEKTVQKFKSNNGSDYTITYMFEKNQPVVNVATKDFSVTLNQEQNWAKGAEYKKGDYKLISKGDNVQFFIKDNEISLSLQ